MVEKTHKYNQIHDNNVTTQQNCALSIVKVNFQERVDFKISNYYFASCLLLRFTVKDVMFLGRTLFLKKRAG